jgi:hypothetical protein
MHTVALAPNLVSHAASRTDTALLHIGCKQVWTFRGEVHGGKASEPVCLRAYGRPATIESYGPRVRLGMDHQSAGQRHSLSPVLVQQARQVLLLLC